MAYNNDSEQSQRTQPKSEFTEKVVSLNRVSKTVKGGRVMKFSALVRRGRRQGPRGLRSGQGQRGFRGHPQGPRGREEEHRAAITLQGTTIPARGRRQVRRRPGAAEAGSRRYRRYRRRRRPCCGGGRGHQQHPHKVPALQQPAATWSRRPMAGPQIPAERAAGRGRTAARPPKRSQVKEGCEMANIKIKLVKSLNGSLREAHRHRPSLSACARSATRPSSPIIRQTRGKIAQIGYLLQVTEE